MREYHAGPMTGYRNYNWQAFEDLAHFRRKKGFEVVTPVEIDVESGAVKVTYNSQGKVASVETTPDFDYEEVLKRDLEAVATCDRIVLLHGWQRSSGAKRELAHALSLGLEVLVEGEARRGF